MKKIATLNHEFVRAIPEKPKDGVLYVSMDYATAVHKCCCGCGREVVTPLSPTDWRLTYDGVAISLNPSIGNWSFPCKSHYWVVGNTIRWADQWSPERIQAGRVFDRHAKGKFFGAANSSPKTNATLPSSIGFWSRVWKWLAG